jgi:oxygen-independent coproporphyrinogen-3 oxidase
MSSDEIARCAKDTVLLDLSKWSENEFYRLGCSRVLESHTAGRAKSGLGGSHTVVTYPPLDALEPIVADNVTQAAGTVGDLHLYAHVAFCEFLCPFCHYATTYTPLSKTHPLVEAYISALCREVKSWRGVLGGSILRSLYIGGGTPTALSTESLLHLLAALQDGYGQTEDLRACIETSPMTATTNDGESKLRAVVAAGINRISIGIQSFDNALSRRSRGYSKSTALKALETVLGLGVEVNVDLIQDLPDQTNESVLDDLQWIGRFMPDQVTWYLLRLRPEAFWYQMYERDDLSLPSEEESVRRRLMIREGMRRLGYLPRPGGRFVREDSVRDDFKEVRGETAMALLGVGVSAYSHGWGYFFRNSAIRSRNRKEQSGIPAYIARINKDGWAIESGLALDETEMTASRLVKAIRGRVMLPKSTPENEIYLAEAQRVLEFLEEQGLVEVAEGFYSLTEMGSLFEEEVCTLFYSSPVKERIRNWSDFWEPQLTPDHGDGGGP